MRENPSRVIPKPDRCPFCEPGPLNAHAGPTSLESRPRLEATRVEGRSSISCPEDNDGPATPSGKVADLRLAHKEVRIAVGVEIAGGAQRISEGAIDMGSSDPDAVEPICKVHMLVEGTPPKDEIGLPDVVFRPRGAHEEIRDGISIHIARCPYEAEARASIPWEKPVEDTPPVRRHLVDRERCRPARPAIDEVDLASGVGPSEVLFYDEDIVEPVAIDISNACCVWGGMGQSERNRAGPPESSLGRLERKATPWGATK